MPTLFETLVKELERPRPILPQVIKHVGAAYGLGRDEIGPFLVNELPKLEDYEIDLILSPVFTPTLEDQAVFAELLGVNTVPSNEWAAMVEQLVARPTVAQLLTEDRVAHPVPLRAVSIERYINRLRLDGSIPAPLFNLLQNLPAPADRPLLKAIARRAVWESDPRRQILFRSLLASAGDSALSANDMLELLKLAEAYQPADIPDLLKRIPHWRQVLQHEINVAGDPKPFFSQRIEEMHGGGRDQRRQDNSRIASKQRELEFLDRLQALLAR